MEERSTTEEILSIEPTTPEFRATNWDKVTYFRIYYEICVMETTILQWLNVIIDVIGLAGNAAVIWLLGFQIQRNAISVYILNLAVADFLYLCFHFMDSLQQITTYFIFSNIYFFNVFFFMFFYSYIMGLSFLSAISLERCLSVLCPIWYRCHHPRHASSYMCVLVWVLSLLFPCLLTFYCEFDDTAYFLNRCQLLRLSSAGYLLFLFVNLLGSSLALTLRMFCGSRRMSLTRLYVTVLFTVLVFIFCGLPYGISHFLLSLFYEPIFDFSCNFLKLSFVLTSVNSCANPIIYFFVGVFQRRQRSTLKQILQRALQDTPEDNECGGSLSQRNLELSGSRVEVLP